LDAHFSNSKLEVCHALDVVAELCCELGDYNTAKERVNRAIEVKSRISGAAGIGLAKSYNIRGAIMLSEDQTAQARSDYIRALAINVRHHGRSRPLPLSIGITLSNIGGVLRKEGNRVPETVSLYREVVDSFESSLSNQENSWMVGSALADLAEALIEEGTISSLSEAKDLLTRALHIFLSTRGVGHPSTERAAALLKSCAAQEPKDTHIEVDVNFVDTLLNECEKVVPRQEGRVSGDVLFLDRRGHVGHGHPHSPLF
jgi:tetratricopeptide (TPR) repeat protein